MSISQMNHKKINYLNLGKKAKTINFLKKAVKHIDMPLHPNEN